MTKEDKARWLVELYSAVAQGKTLQYFREDIWNDVYDGPDLSSSQKYWRIKPEPMQHTAKVSMHTTNPTIPVVLLPNNFEPGMRVQVTQILEDE